MPMIRILLNKASFFDWKYKAATRQFHRHGIFESYTSWMYLAGMGCTCKLVPVNDPNVFTPLSTVMAMKSNNDALASSFTHCMHLISFLRISWLVRNFSTERNKIALRESLSETSFERSNLSFFTRNNLCCGVIQEEEVSHGVVPPQRKQATLNQASTSTFLSLANVPFTHSITLWSMRSRSVMRPTQLITSGNELFGIVGVNT